MERERDVGPATLVNSARHVCRISAAVRWTTVTSRSRPQQRIISYMARPSARFAKVPGKRANHNWASGRPIRPTANTPCQFEIQVRRLRLSRQDYEASTELKEWCFSNKNKCYIPEWLLERW